MSRLTVIFYGIILLSPLYGQINKEEVITEYRHVIRALTHDSLSGRPFGTRHEEKASKFLYQLLKTGKEFRPTYQHFSWKQADGSVGSSVNVICFLNNKSDSTIIIAAHYDHIGRGDREQARALFDKAYFQGADDNASGVALMVGLARRYKAWKSEGYNYVFAALGAGEAGSRGAEALLEYGRKRFRHVALMVNLKMVGRLNMNDPVVKVAGANSLKARRTYFVQPVGLVHYRFSPDSVAQKLDIWPYIRAGYPAVSFSTGVHSDYKTLDDTERRINYEGIWMVQGVVEAFLKSYAVRAED